MALGIFFWILMLLWLVLGGMLYVRGRAAAGSGMAFGGDLLAFVIVAVLGWAVFGAAIQG